MQELIEKAYSKLGYKPREGQIPIIESILKEFIVNRKRNVVLCASTGIGKSIIAAVVAECLSMKNNPDRSSIILMHQNALTKQYHESFSHLDESEFFQIKGAGTYQCAALEARKVKNTTAEDCVKKELTPLETAKFCDGCEFAHSRKLINVTQNLITNYSYFFISKLWSEHIADRSLHVFDEAHMLNEIFCEHTAVHFSVERLDSYIKELSVETNNKCENEVFKLTLFKKDLEHKNIKESNYKVKIAELHSIYKSISSKCKDLAERHSDVSAKAKFGKLYKKYFGLGCKIGDLLEHDFEHVFDDSIPNEITIKSVFISGMMNIMLGQFNLFMSATITPQFVRDTYGLESKDTAFLNPEPLFPADNSPLFFLGSKTLNYNNMQDPATIAELKQSVGRITSFHSKDKGLILTPSFKLTEELAKSIKGKAFVHKPKEKLSDLIEQFKAHKGQAVLISPSLFEGLDFTGDFSRYQIIVKTPYASLGDKRIKRILDEYPSVYKQMTLFKVIQGIGRSVRTPEDFAASYFLDKNSAMLFNSQDNIWKNRFLVKAQA